MRTWNGLCILFLVAGGCGAPEPIGLGAGIRAAHCRDGVRGNDESDLDCGGKDCAACDDGRACAGAGDCKNGRCDENVCRPPKEGCGPCAPAHATGQCVEDQCAIAACDEGYADCDQDVASGCEADLMSDGDHCGACGEECHGGECARGVCAGKLECELPMADCNGDPSDFCEADLLGDAANCGGCGIVCDGSPCLRGHCKVDPRDCEKLGLADCNGKPDDSCETDIMFDPQHCGGCGVACDRRQVCYLGHCK